MLRTTRQFAPALLGLEPRVVPSKLLSPTFAPVLHLRETPPLKTPNRPVVMIEHLAKAQTAVATAAAGSRHGLVRDVGSFATKAHTPAHKKIEPTKPK
jgi:hypothetical protein